MDGKHVTLKAPSNSGSMFYNYKCFHSIVLFAVADAQYTFTYFDVGAYGSEGDAIVFATSLLGKKLAANEIHFPPDAMIEGDCFQYYFLDKLKNSVADFVNSTISIFLVTMDLPLVKDC